MRLTARRLLILLLIIGLSIGFGFAYDGIATAVEAHQYPRPEKYLALVNEQSKEFGVPPSVIWALVRCESNFASDTATDDGIGLLQISPQLLEYVYEHLFREATPDSGILYDPRTNLRVGTAWLSELYRAYGAWDAVYAAWFAGTDTVNGWLADDACLNQQGQLANIPHAPTAQFVSNVREAVGMYAKLYD